MSPSRTILGGFLAGTMFFGATGAFAQTAPATEPTALDRLTACRGIGDAVARLACFDREVAALDAAEDAGDVVVVNREDIRQARRAVFGFSLPSFTLLDRGASPDAPIDRIESTVRSGTRVGDGDWLITLEDGSVWRQIDDQNLNYARGGQPVLVRRGAVGSYFLSVDGARSMRVRRQE